jgi:hypothetical protein
MEIDSYPVFRILELLQPRRLARGEPSVRTAVRDGHNVGLLQPLRWAEGELSVRMVALGGHIQALEWRRRLRLQRE